MAGTFTPPAQTGIRYRVYMTPRTGLYTYGTEIEVTDKITQDGIDTMQKAIDSQDFEVGVYFYGDIHLKGYNYNGYFNENDLRSIFPYYRDLTKVRIVYENSSGDTIVYRGLIKDSATTVDLLEDTIEFNVLSQDSVISNAQVTGGLITNGMTVKNAVFAILNQPSISSVLSVSIGNINPYLNFTIDVGSYFDNSQAQDALNTLLIASNSVMTIDSNWVVTIKDRNATTTTAVLNLYGPYDLQRRQNIISVSNYNNGLQRTFTSVISQDSTNTKRAQSSVYFSTVFGFNEKEFDLPFMNDATKIASIQNTLLNEFCVPKVELMVEVPSSVAHGVDLLDRVSINWPFRIWPNNGNFMPVIGTSTIGNTVTPLPNKSGSFFIDPNMAFKVIEIAEDPTTFTSTLKLRQIGNTLADGWFTSGVSSIVGFAVVGASPIGGTGSTDAQWNPSVIGAARVGSTLVVSS